MAGGSADREARYLDPTILYPVTWDDPIMEDEIFGPILPVLTYKDMDAARKQGRVGGRRPKLKPHQQQEIVNLVTSGKKTAADAARLFNVHPATVSRLLQRAKSP